MDIPFKAEHYPLLLPAPRPGVDLYVSNHILQRISDEGWERH